MSELLHLDPQWVTLRAVTDDGLPVVVVVDQAVALTCPHPDHPVQVAVGVSFTAGDDGLPAGPDAERLKEVEQRLVDAAVGAARLVAVMTLDGVREWTFYGAAGDWAGPVREAGLSVLVTDDPAYQGLRELAGLSS